MAPLSGARQQCSPGRDGQGASSGDRDPVAHADSEAAAEAEDSEAAAKAEDSEEAGGSTFESRLARRKHRRHLRRLRS